MLTEQFFIRLVLSMLIGMFSVSRSAPALAVNKEDANTHRPEAVSTVSAHCGLALPSYQWRQGVVASVQDGDSFTLEHAADGIRVRLDSIDAPELDQAYGYAAKAALSKALLGRQVTLAVSKTDRYGRLVAAVFTDDCRFINLAQVSSGMAWFYRAYACEISLDLRQQFVRAESAAVRAGRGLWAQVAPVAPWVHRNGFEPGLVVCETSPGLVGAQPKER
jgi:endonuclease YncB( thermonuclease family)